MQKKLRELDDKSKEIDLIIKRSNPMFKDNVEANKIVKKFISDKKLIIYGGTAIDYLLRIKGTKIYPDELMEIADLDFLSADNVSDAFELTDILYNAGFEGVKTARGRHIQTMRIDIGNGNIVADIGYCPANIFNMITFIEYEDLRFIHPDFQKIDVHSALMKPYDNPAAEVIFQRWCKDIKRFNLLDKYYPTIKPSITIKPNTLSKCKLPIKYASTFCGYGYLAYACIYKYCSSIDMDLSNIPELSVSIVGSDIVYDSPIKQVELMSCNVDEDIKNMKIDITANAASAFTIYNAQREYIFKRYQSSNMIIYDTNGCLMTYNTMTIDKTTLKYSNIQGVLKHLLASALLNSDNVALYYYVGLRTLITNYETKMNSFFIANMVSSDLKQEEYIDKCWSEHVKTADSPLLPSIKAYGMSNKSDFIDVLQETLESEIHGDIPKPYLPYAYSPQNFKEKKLQPPPKFNYSDSKYFQFDGKELRS